MWVRWTGLTAGVLLVASCSSSTSPGGGGGHSTTITVSDNKFTPTPDTVSAGMVTFSWAGSNSHNVTWDAGPTPLPTNSATQSAGSYNATLTVGTYQYHCVVHGSAMSGTIVVH
jgi:plastocyanin